MHEYAAETTKDVVARLDNLIREIVEMYEGLDVTDVYVDNKSSFGGRSAEAPLPGGALLVLMGPWNGNGNEGDGTLHPEQVLVEWADTIGSAMGGGRIHHLSARAAAAFLRAEMTWIVSSPWRHNFSSEIERLHRYLLSLGTPPEVDKTFDATLEVESEARMSRLRLQSRADQIPAGTRLKPQQADLIWPGIAVRIRVARSRKSADVPSRASDGTYASEDLARFAESARCTDRRG